VFKRKLPTRTLNSNKGRWNNLGEAKLSLHKEVLWYFSERPVVYKFNSAELKSNQKGVDEIRNDKLQIKLNLQSITIIWSSSYYK